MIKFFGQPTRPDTHLPTDRARLIDSEYDENVFLADDSDDDDDDDHVDEGGDTDDKDIDDNSFKCEKCRSHETTPSGESRKRAYPSSADVIEVCIVEEGQAETKEKKKKKPLRKRVRKRVWRVMRSSWKCFRRGMAVYSPGLGSLFAWGVNFNQATSAAKTSHRTKHS